VTRPLDRLVPFAETHLAATLGWVNDPAMMRLLGRAKRVESVEHQRWFEHIDAADAKPEVCFLFGDEASRGRGYGSEAIDLLAGIAFNSMNLHRLYAYVFAINPRAKRAFEKAGFQVEGAVAAGGADCGRAGGRLRSRQAPVRRRLAAAAAGPLTHSLPDRDTEPLSGDWRIRRRTASDIRSSTGASAPRPR
jgi:RimJ/RimL family protein N-acetyltransferase